MTPALLNYRSIVLQNLPPQLYGDAKNWVEHLNQSEPQDVNHQAEKILNNFQIEDETFFHSSQRYRFSNGMESPSPRDRLLFLLFKKSIEGNRGALVCKQAELIDAPIEVNRYPKWKKLCLIQIPQSIESGLESSYIQVAARVVFFVGVVLVLKSLTSRVNYFVIGKAVPFLINHIPVQLMRMWNRVLKGKDWLLNHRISVLFSLYFSKGLIKLFNLRIPYVTPLFNIVPWNVYKLVLAPSSVAMTVFTEALSLSYLGAQGCQVAASLVHSATAEYRSQCQKLEKEYAYQLWLKATTS